MKRSLVILLTAVSISAMTAGTAFPAFAEATEAEAEETKDGAENAADSELEDGVYGVEFDTDSSMFHVNEACNGRATLTVKDGKMTVHITLVSKNIENVFLGTAEDAQKNILPERAKQNKYKKGHRMNRFRSCDVPFRLLINPYSLPRQLHL